MSHLLSSLGRAVFLAGTLLLGVASAQDGTPTPNAPAGFITVQAGDTAYSIARRAGITVDHLLQLNHLASPNLRIGQVLRVADTLTYTVQPGEAFYGIARRAGVTVDALLAENGLQPGAVLAVGQVLKLPAGATLPTVALPPAPAAAFLPSPTPTVQGPPAPAPGGVNGSPFQPGAPVQTAPTLISPDQLPVPGTPTGQTPTPTAPTLNWRDAALALLGTPYVYGGTSRSGTDCSGLVLQVFTPLGLKLPRVSSQQALAGLAVNAADLLPGDLVFFDTEGKGRVTHVGIYLGDDQFINANSYAGKVVIDRLMSDKYWGPRYLWARRVLGFTAQVP